MEVQENSGKMVTKVPPKLIKEVGFDFHWDNKKVWKLDVPIAEMDIKKLEWMLDLPFWDLPDNHYTLSPNQILANPKKYRAEYERTMKSDLKHPIDIMFNKGRWLVLDGLHRLVKAKALGMKNVNVRKIPRAMIKDILK